MDTKAIPSGEELKDLARELILSQNTMTLATAHENESWAAPVYYAAMPFNFYFFSSPTSRHILEAAGSGRVSAAVFQQADSWKDIRGIQMSGVVTPLSIGMESARALRAYLRKYPFTRDFFDGTRAPDLEGFIHRFRVRLYRFEPTLMYYMDNHIRFSFREEIDLT